MHNASVLHLRFPFCVCVCVCVCVSSRLENQKLKELVTGGADPAVQTDSEPEDAKEEPVKEESPSVRSKMEMTTPSKVGKMSQSQPLKCVRF